MGAPKCRLQKIVARPQASQQILITMKKTSVAPQPSYPRLSPNPQDEHAFYELGSRRFEQFARALHAAQPDILSTILYGPDGQEQFGVDHIAFHSTDAAPYIEVSQSKAERRFGQSDIRTAADKFLKHWDGHWRDKDVRRFILFVGCAIKSQQAGDEFITQTQRFAALGIEFSVWDSTEIFDQLPGANVPSEPISAKTGTSAFLVSQQAP